MYNVYGLLIKFSYEIFYLFVLKLYEIVTNISK